MEEERKRLVLVEDEKFMIEFFTQALTDAGYDVTHFVSADDAMEEIPKLLQLPHVILTDNNSRKRENGSESKLEGLDLIKAYADSGIGLVLMTVSQIEPEQVTHRAPHASLWLKHHDFGQLLNLLKDAPKKAMEHKIGIRKHQGEAPPLP